MNQNQRQPSGSLKVSEEVLATIAKVSALEVDGVAGLAEPTGKVSRFFHREFGKSAIDITLNEGFARVGIVINVNYGSKLEDVCSSVQQKIKENIQMMTGMAVLKVNVRVEGIVFQNAANEPAYQN